MKRLGILLLPPGWDASPSQRYPPQHYDRRTHLYTWVKRNNVEQSFLSTYILLWCDLFFIFVLESKIWIIFSLSLVTLMDVNRFHNLLDCAFFVDWRVCGGRSSFAVLAQVLFKQ